MSLNHTDRSVHSEGDVIQRGAGQFLLEVPVLADAGQRPRVAVGVVEFGVGKSDRAQGMSALESNHTLLLLRAICQIDTAKALKTRRERGILALVVFVFHKISIRHCVSKY